MTADNCNRVKNYSYGRYGW